MPSDDEFSCPDTPEEISSSAPVPRVPQEASGDWRQSAAQTRQFYVSLVNAGFSTEEALDLVKVVIKTAAERGLSQDD